MRCSATSTNQFCTYTSGVRWLVGAALLEIAELLAPATDVAPLAGATLVDIVALIGAVAVELVAAGTVELVVDVLAGLASVVDGLAVGPSLL